MILPRSDVRRHSLSTMAAAAAPAPTRPPLLRGVIFDMDGTLTVPNLDFVEMYRRAGVPRGDDILSAKWRADEQASMVVEEMESEGRRTLSLMPGAAELAAWLGTHCIPMALVTRNSVRTVEHFHTTCWPAGIPAMNPAISRDDPYPAKPDPSAMAAVQAAWGTTDGDSLLMCAPSTRTFIGQLIHSYIDIRSC